MSDELERYKGELTRDQLITAREKIFINAKNLFEEAKILYNNNRYARSYFLLCICNEELGKYIMVTSAIVELINGSIVWKKFWNRLRSHKAKTGTMWHTENVVVSSDENFSNPSDIQNVLPLFEEFKMASLYSDMFQYDFFEPEEITPRHIVDALMLLTSNRVSFVDSSSVTRETLNSLTKEQIIQFRSKLEGMKEIQTPTTPA